MVTQEIRGTHGKSRTFRLLISLVLAGLFVAGCSSSNSASQSFSQPIDPAAPFTPKVKGLVAALTLDEKLSLVHGNGFDPANYAALDSQPLGAVGMLPGVPRLGIPPRRDADALGINVYADSTAPPARLAIGASFDRGAALRLGQMEGTEGRALGVDLLYGPKVDVDPLPNSSSANLIYGEDPYLTGQLTVQEVNGVQSQGLMAQLKHMAPYNVANAGPAAFGGSPPSLVDDQTTHELYLAPLEDAVRMAQPASLMCSYASFEITPLQTSPSYGCENALLLNTILRDQWGFRGFVLSDYGATHSTSIVQGLDQDFPGPVQGVPNFDPGYLDSLLKPLADRTSPTFNPAYVSALDESVARVLYEMERFGLLACASPSGPISGCTVPARPTLDKTADAATVEQLSEEGAVLLKNEGNLLPLQPTDLTRGIAVIGPTANLLPASPGTERARGFGDRNRISPLAALKQMAPADSSITFAPGVDRLGIVVPASAVPGGWARQQNGAAAGMDATLDFGASNPLTAGVVYTWTATLQVPTDDTYALWLQSSAGTIISTGAVNPRSGSPSPFSGSPTILALDGKNVKLAIPSTIQANTFPGGDMVGDQYLGLNSWGAYAVLTPGPHTVTINFKVPPNAVTPVLFRFTWSPVQATMNAAVSLAKSVPRAIVFIDDANATSAPGSVNSLGPYEDQLVTAIAAANPRTIVVLNTGNPVLMPWLDRVQSVLEMWYPGQEGGTATAKLLFGQANPGGRLPITFPASANDTPFAGHPERVVGVNGQLNWSEGIFMGYRWYDRQNLQPLFEFGYGLSFTQFKYSNLTVSSANDGGVDVSFRVQNVGSREGDEIPQVYVGPPSNPPIGVQFAVKQLAMFTRLTVAPNQSRDVKLHIAPRQLSYWSTAQQNWVLLRGGRVVYVGASSRDIRLQGMMP